MASLVAHLSSSRTPLVSLSLCRSTSTPTARARSRTRTSSRSSARTSTSALVSLVCCTRCSRHKHVLTLPAIYSPGPWSPKAAVPQHGIIRSLRQLRVLLGAAQEAPALSSVFPRSLPVVLGLHRRSHHHSPRRCIARASHPSHIASEVHPSAIYHHTTMFIIIPPTPAHALFLSTPPSRLPHRLSASNCTLVAPLLQPARPAMTHDPSRTHLSSRSWSPQCSLPHALSLGPAQAITPDLTLDIYGYRTAL